jgi:hypothetical protein
MVLPQVQWAWGVLRTWDFNLQQSARMDKWALSCGAERHSNAACRKPDGLKSKIPAGKRVIGDEGYKGGLQISTRNAQDTRAVKILKNRAKARQDTFNKRIKIFKILDERFRHSVKKHKAAFEAVCVLVQYEMENGHSLFTI